MGAVTIPAAPRRVAALDESYVDAAIALDTNVVAYTDYRGVHGGLPAYLGTDARRYAADAVDLGPLTSPDLEKLVASRPDLIVSAKVRHAQIYGQLTRIAPTVFSATTGPTWQANIRLLAAALGKTTLAERKLADYHARARRIGDEIRAKLGRNPTVSIVRFAGEQTVRLYSQNSFSGSVITDTGLTLSAASRTSDPTSIDNDISAERILDLDADHIFVSVYDDPQGTARRVERQFAGNPLWDRLSGARTTVDDLTWMTAVGLQGANRILDDLARTFGVTP